MGYLIDLSSRHYYSISISINLFMVMINSMIYKYAGGTTTYVSSHKMKK